MAGRCVNGHDGPTNRPDCMYCGGAMLVAPPQPLPVRAWPTAAGPAGPAPATRPRPFSGIAVASLVVGLASLGIGLVLPIWVTGLGGLFATVMALSAFSEISSKRRRGTVIALAGLVSGLLGMLAVVVVFFAGGIVD